jgi:hypothetical protein
MITSVLDNLDPINIASLLFIGIILFYFIPNIPLLDI